MSATRFLTILGLSLAMTVFTFGCGSEGGGAPAGGSGGGGAGGSAGSAGSGGEGGVGGALIAAIYEAFDDSLHNTRVGKDFWYSKDQNGFESLTNVPIEDMGCIDCHAKADTEWDGPGCDNCHGEGSGGAGGMDIPKHLDSATCLGCHSRQGAEGMMIQGMDFHSAMNCAACHGDRSDDANVVDANDVHGTLGGVAYDTMVRPGAIKARCTDCHEAAGSGGAGGTGGAPPIPENTYHSGLHANVDCALCHTETVISCMNCHLEDDVDNQQKCNSGKIFNWKFVMKWDREGDGNEVFHPGTIMTLKYNCDRPGDHPDCGGDPNDDMKTVAVFAPYYAHTVTQQAMDNITNTPGDPTAPPPGNTAGCAYCHSTANCDDLNAANMNDRFPLIEFEGTGGAGGTGGPTGKLVNRMSGLIPLPPDYKTKFSVDYVEWQEGAGTGCPTDDPPTKPLVKAETGPDLWQTGADTGAARIRELGAPLSQDEFQTFCPP